MRRFAAVLAHELALRRRMPLQALAMGLVPWLVTLAPLRHPEDVRFATALLGALLLGALSALLLGATTVAGELKSERLGFLFAQPLAGGTIWAAKMAAVSLLAVSAMVLVLLPTALFEPAPFLAPAMRALLAAVALALPALALVGHLAGSALHGRNAWLALHLTALAGAALSIAATYQLLRREGATQLFWIAAGLTLVALAAGLALAGWLQLSRGRTSLARSDRLLALAVAACLALAAAGLGLFGRWATQPTPADLLGVQAARPRGADWIEVHGAYRGRPGYHPALLIHRAGGAHVTLPGYPPAQATRWATASNERTLVWLDYDATQTDWKLWQVDLSAARPRPTLTGAQGGDVPLRLALAPDGRKVASVDMSLLEGVPLKLLVRELPSGRVLAARTLPREAWESWVLAFDDAQHVSFVAGFQRAGSLGAARYRLALDSGALDLALEIPDLATGEEAFPSSGPEWRRPVFSPDGETVLGPDALYSMRTGERLASRAEVAVVELLDRGRFVAGPRRIDERRRHLDVVRLAGARLELRSPDSGTVELPDLGATSLRFAGETSEGALVVATYGPAGSRYWLLPPPPGEPLALGEAWQTVVPGPRGTLLAIDRRGGLASLDAAGGAATVLVAGRLDPGHEWDRRGLRWWERFIAEIF